MPLEAAFALAIGLLLRHVVQHRELLRGRWSPATSHGRALHIQQVDSGLAGVARAFDRRHHPKGEVRGGWKQVLGLHWCVVRVPPLTMIEPMVRSLRVPKGMLPLPFQFGPHGPPDLRP